MTTNQIKPSWLDGSLRTFLPMLILAAGGAACCFLYEARLRPSEHPVEKIKPPVVEAVPILPKTDGFEIVLGGEVVPYREIEIAAEVSGRIVTDRTRAGFFARKGDLLLEIDPTNYELDVRRLSEEVLQAESGLDENTVETENVRKLIELSKKEHLLQVKEHDRSSRLVQNHVVSESEHDTAKRDVVVTLRNLTELENRSDILKQKRIDLQSVLEQKKIALERAEEDLKRCRIVAPCDGMIVRDSTEPGNYVSVGQSLLVFEDVTKVLYWLWLQQNSRKTDENIAKSSYEIPETDAIVSWTVEGRTWSWQGKLSRYDGHGINAATRTATVRIEISNPQSVLDSGSEYEMRPPVLARGVYVTSSIHVDSGVSLWQIPTAAMRSGNKIYTVGGERLEIRDVQVVQRNKDFSIIRLPSDDDSPSLCVVSPLVHPQQGMAVRVLERVKASDTSTASIQRGGRR